MSDIEKLATTLVDRALDIELSRTRTVEAGSYLPTSALLKQAASALRNLEERARDFAALQQAIVGDTGASAILHVEKLKEALKQCADDLEAEIIGRSPTRPAEYTIEKRRRERDLEPVRYARHLLGEPKP